MRLFTRPISATPIGMAAKRFNRAVKQTACNLFPSKVINSEKVINSLGWMGEEISSAESRLIMGATALVTQPFIDAANKNVDEKTRKISVARTCAKIIAGTLTGYAIRKGCIRGVDAFSKLASSVTKSGAPVKLTKWNTILSPETNILASSDSYKQYKNALGTVLALVVMMFTNFAIDAPLTKFLTNVFAKLGGKNETSV